MNVEVAQDSTRPTLPRPDAGFAVLISAAVALLITIGEIDALLSQVLDDGRTWSVTQLSGLAAPLHPSETLDGWRFFAERAPASNGQVDGWLRMYAAIDALLALTYGLLGFLWFRRFRPRAFGAVGVALVLIGAGADVLENLLIALSTHQGAAFGGLLLVSTAVKWAALVPAAAMTLWTLRHGLALLPKALYTHRYSALIVLPLAALSLGRGPDLLEQVPDIQRAWADPGQHADFLFAGLVMAALGVAALVIGRQRTGYLWHRTCPLWTGEQHPCPEGTCPVEFRREHWHPPLPLLRLWFLGPASLILLGLALGLAGAEVRPARLAAFCALPVVVGLISLRLRAVWDGDQSRRPSRAPISLARFHSTALLGDVLVGLLPVVAGLGAIRAFAGPLALSGATAWSAALFIAGWIAVALAWPVLAVVHRALTQWADRLPADFEASSGLDRLLVQLTPGLSMNRGRPPADDPDAAFAERIRTFFRGFSAQRTAWIVLLVGGTTLIVVGLLPVALAQTFGVIAVFQLALGSLSVVIAAIVILLQPGGAPEAFWPLRIPFAPVTALILIAAFAGAGLGGDDVHRIRPYAGAQADLGPTDRPELGEVFDGWLRSGRSCAEPLPDAAGLQVRPLLMYAAEGGGVRAAYWTTSAIDLLAGQSDAAGAVAPVCRSAFLSSGASGGSVGLSVAAVRPPGRAAESVAAMAGPEALGAAADGLVIRDNVYASSGIPLPSLRDRTTEGATWSDRGTLIEQSWAREVPALNRPWVQPRPVQRWTWGPTGALVVNSTSPTTSCRTLISQIQLPGDGTECAPGQPAPASTDLVQCTGQLRTVTAALLTARFPYVTPSGVIDCPGPDGLAGTGDDVSTQVVDGGYAENTGVGTLVDLMPRILAEVRHHNSCVLGGVGPRLPGCDGEKAMTTLVVPQLVYFDNGTGSDLVKQRGGLTLEALVPPLTILKAKGALYSARAQLERAHALLALDQLWDSTTDLALTATPAVDAWRGNQVAVVYQATRPSIAAPLGWVLSRASIAAMDAALCDQDPVEDLEFGAAATPDVTEPDPPTRFGTIEDVLDLLPGAAAGCRR
ncbi:hypothetical protein [Nocardioides sp.]|uniref:hypothetical protein n=1 Tax=Nocardioides sp. TaxID=35761 RepID=UPI0035668E87